jgi:pimeloyl-ACP methyl ester carboxylesterase
VRWLSFVSTLDPIVSAHSAVPANRQATRVTVDAAGHCGMLLDPEVIARIMAETTLFLEPAAAPSASLAA